MRISDWSSDVCSSDLRQGIGRRMRLVDADRLDRQHVIEQRGEAGMLHRGAQHGRAAVGQDSGLEAGGAHPPEHRRQIGRAACWGSVWQYGETQEVAVSI